METRTEKYKRRRKEKRILKLKFFIMLCVLGIMFVGLNIVYQTARDLDCLSNSSILNYDFSNNILELLGKTYYIDFQIIKRHF